MPDPPKLPDNRKATRYAELLHTATGGHALFQPSNNVFVGDCGYIDRGKFIKLFNVFRVERYKVLPSLNREDFHISTDEPLNGERVYSSNALQMTINAEVGVPVSGIPKLEGIVGFSQEINEAAFLAFGGESHLVEEISDTQPLLEYLLNNSGKLRDTFRRFGLKSGDIVIIGGTTKTCSWFGGVAFSDSITAKVTLKLDSVLGVTMDVSRSQGSQEPQPRDNNNNAVHTPLTFYQTAGPKGVISLERHDHCVVVQLVAALAWDQVLHRLKEILKLKFFHRDEAEKGSQERHVSGSSRAPSDNTRALGPRSSTTGQGYSEASTSTQDNTELNRDPTLHQTFLDCILDANPDIDMVAVNQGTIVALAKFHNINSRAEIRTKYHAMQKNFTLRRSRTADEKLAACPELNPVLVLDTVESSAIVTSSTFADKLDAAILSLVLACRRRGIGTSMGSITANQSKEDALYCLLSLLGGDDILTAYLAGFVLGDLAEIGTWREIFRSLDVFSRVQEIVETGDNPIVPDQDIDPSIADLPDTVLNSLISLIMNKVPPATHLLQSLQKIEDLSSTEVLHASISDDYEEEKGEDTNGRRSWIARLFGKIRPDAKARHTLQSAAPKGDEARERKLLPEKGGDVDAQGQEYKDALVAAKARDKAAGAKDKDVVGAALFGARAASVDAPLKPWEIVNARKALVSAAARGDEELVKLLLCDLKAEDEPAFHDASSRGHEAAAGLLIQRGADDNALNALVAASSSGHAGIAKLLLDHGADVNVGNPLKAAASSGHAGTVKLLLDHGADLHVHVWEEGNLVSALTVASSKGYQEVVELLLLVQGVDLEIGHPLDLASSAGHEGIVKLLLEKGADANAGDALQAASSKGYKAIVELLLDYGADIDDEGGYGTALQEASSAGQTAIVKLLRDRGAV